MGRPRRWRTCWRTGVSDSQKGANSVQQFSVAQMTGGWFVGDFEPSVIRTQAFEVAVKYYQAGDRESRHVHKMADEITVVAQGKVRMSGRTFTTGDIILIPVDEPTDFEVLEPAITVVVKRPSVIGDKYEVEEGA